MKFTNIKTKKIKHFFNNLPEWLAKHTFLVVLALLAIALNLGAIVFYTYGIVLNTGPAEEEKLPEFDSKTFKEVVEEWEQRETALQSIHLENFNNPFD